MLESTHGCSMHAEYPLKLYDNPEKLNKKNVSFLQLNLGVVLKKNYPVAIYHGKRHIRIDCNMQREPFSPYLWKLPLV